PPVDLCRVGVPARTPGAPAPDRCLQLLPQLRPEQLGVPPPGRHPPGGRVHDHHAHAHRPGQGPAAHLVHPGHQRVPGSQQLALQRAGGGGRPHGSGTPANVSEGLLSHVMRSRGQVMTNALPTTLRTGTNPPPTAPACARESAERGRLSPSTNRWSSCTTTSNGLSLGTAPGTT